MGGETHCSEPSGPTPAPGDPGIHKAALTSQVAWLLELLLPSLGMVDAQARLQSHPAISTVWFDFNLKVRQRKQVLVSTTEPLAARRQG